MNSTWFLPSFTGFFRVLSSFTKFYRVLLGFTEFYRVWLRLWHLEPHSWPSSPPPLWSTFNRLNSIDSTTGAAIDRVAQLWPRFLFTEFRFTEFSLAPPLPHPHPHPSEIEMNSLDDLRVFLLLLLFSPSTWSLSIKKNGRPFDSVNQTKWRRFLETPPFQKGSI